MRPRKDCLKHRLPLSKFDTVSKAFLCPKCLAESLFDLQAERIQVQREYSEFQKSVREQSKSVQRLQRWFSEEGVEELKTLLQSKQTQLNQLLQKQFQAELIQANIRLKQFYQTEHKRWDFLSHDAEPQLMELVQNDSMFSVLSGRMEKAKAEQRKAIERRLRDVAQAFIERLLQGS